MWNIDITKLLGCPPGFEEENYYTFNPSIIAIPEHSNYYLLAYRICYYDISVRLHPWKIWDNGYKYFSDPENVMSRKYRNILGCEFSTLFDKPFYDSPPLEYDSTGLAILHFYDNKFHIKYNMYCPFGQEMNQDARLTVINNVIYISYNVFEKHNRSPKATMRFRTLYIDFNSDSLSMSSEQYMFSHRYNNFEKNCIITPKCIIYGVGNTFDYIVNDQIIKKKSPFRKLVDHYGETNIYSSSSTPVIKYGDKWLGCAHIKVKYKNINKIMPFKYFFTQANKNIKHHGKYIYFAAFYEFDDNMNITRVSNPFIPTYFSDHLPYLLCMPTGLMHFNKKIMLSYGEGDCKCKMIVLRLDEVEQLLQPEVDLGFYFLTNTFNLQHFGYFRAFNAGDEAFQHVFTYLWKKYYPMADIKFTTPYGTIYKEPTILGGGDVINTHFIDLVPKDVVLAAIGVGIPYIEFDPLVKKFTDVVLRNKSDAKRLKLPYAPDLAFLLPHVYKLSGIKRTPKLIGISVLRTYYNIKFLESYTNYVKEMTVFIKILIDNGFTIVLIPFCINPNQSKENDIITCREISNGVKNESKCQIFMPSIKNQVYDVYLQIAKVEFMICARFHSHIFSTIHATPFISLTCGRKCIEFMQQENLKGYLFKLKTEKWDLPKTINVVALLEFFNTKYNERNIIHERLKQTRKYIFNQLHNFESTYINIVKKLVGNGKIILFPQLEQESISQFINLDKTKELQSKFFTSTSTQQQLVCENKPNLHLNKPSNQQTQLVQAQPQQTQLVQAQQPQTQLVQVPQQQTQLVQVHQPQLVQVHQPHLVQMQAQPPQTQLVQIHQPQLIQVQAQAQQPQTQLVQIQAQQLQTQLVQIQAQQPQTQLVQAQTQLIQIQPQTQLVQAQSHVQPIQYVHQQSHVQPIQYVHQQSQVQQMPIQYVHQQSQVQQMPIQYVHQQSQVQQMPTQYVQPHQQQVQQVQQMQQMQQMQQPLYIQPQVIQVDVPRIQYIESQQQQQQQQIQVANYINQNSSDVSNFI